MGEEQCQEWGVVPKLPNAGEFVVFLGVKICAISHAQHANHAPGHVLGPGLTLPQPAAAHAQQDLRQLGALRA